MKALSIFLSMILVVCACNNKSNQSSAATTDTTKQEEMKAMIPTTACYLSTAGKDSFFLKTEIFPNVVTGILSYTFHDKDSNTGDIDGKLTGDTLVADYTFTSEGKTSVRQVVFLIKDSIATEGYGSMVEKDGKMVFKNLNAVDFTKGIKLRKVPCAGQ